MIEINGKVYRNLQEQVEKNKDDIEDTNDRIDTLLEAEDDEYKTELVFEPDDAYLKYYDKDPENPQDYTWGLAQKCFEIERLSQRHLYEHNVTLQVKLKNAGVTSDTYTARINVRIYLPTFEQLTEETLKQRVKTATRVIATGYAIDTAYEYNYTVIGLVKYSDQISPDLEVDLIPTNRYAASGFISSNIGEITALTDKVVTII